MSDKPKVIDDGAVILTTPEGILRFRLAAAFHAAQFFQVTGNHIHSPRTTRAAWLILFQAMSLSPSQSRRTRERLLVDVARVFKFNLRPELAPRGR